MPKFTDISGHWAEVDIEEAARLGLVAGYPDGTFRPDLPVTRAEEAAIEVRQVRRLFAMFNAASTSLRQMVAPAIVHIATHTGLGSGVLVSPTGLVVTCDHVVQGTDIAVASFPSWDGGQYAEPGLDLIMRRPEQDLALGRVRWPDMAKQRGFPNLRSSTGTLEPGELVTVIGSPAGLQAWQSMGIVARGPVAIDYYGGVQLLLSLSAAVNPGNSGGAVIRAEDGTLAGIASMKLADVAIEAMAFAVPVAQVERLLADALEAGLITADELGKGGEHGQAV